MKKKLNETDKHCPNLFYEGEEILIGEFLTWEDYENCTFKELWNLDKYMFKYKTMVENYHYFIIHQQHDTTDERWMLFYADEDGDVIEMRDMKNNIFNTEKHSHKYLDFIQKRIHIRCGK